MQHNDFAKAYKTLRMMFETTSKENKDLLNQVTILSNQVKALNGQVQQLEKYYSMKRN
uniref:MbeD/MobD family mobilization/exclusion protein n=1 Tax=Photobacterium carnosum TaxID=2023717 RepID=UPI003988ED8A